MKLILFQIRRFRAFDSDVSIPLSDFTVLTGPNNLGKSTVLKALDLFFAEIGGKQRSPFQIRTDRPERYSPEIDYPKLYEGKPGRRYSTRLTGRFEFSDGDIEFVKINHSLALPPSVDLTLEIHKENEKIIRQLTLSPLQNQDDEDTFLRWFVSSFRYLYIPANRNVSDFRRSVFSEIVSGAIQKVKNSRQRLSALENLYADVRSLIGNVEGQLIHDLQPYLPELKDIKFVLDEPEILNFISLGDVQIDDGARTSITQKGDGVKSLFVMAILQFLAKQHYQRNLMFGIEEPEAHLHSSAIYDTKAGLRSLSSSFQILITTHSPILVQRDNVAANIIIDRKPGSDFSCVAVQAKNLSQIRQSLGIRPQENLTTANVTLVVEGATEERILGKLLVHLKPDLAKAIVDGSVRVLGAGGASKSLSVIRALARDAASCVVMFDSDIAGLRAFDEVKNSGLVNILDLFTVPARSGCAETEFEDHFSPDIYIAAIADACGCSFDSSLYLAARTKSGNAKTKMKKWSDVMTNLVQSCGRNWPDIENTAKQAFATAILRDLVKSVSQNTIWLGSIGDRVVSNLKET